MTGFGHRLISWGLLFGLLLGGALFASTELLRLHQSQRLALNSHRLDAAVVQDTALRLPKLRAELARLDRSDDTDGLYWTGASPGQALLDVQETVGALVAESGMRLIEIDRRVSDDDDSAGVMRVFLRMQGSLAGVQAALFRLETHVPKVAVHRARIAPDPRNRDIEPQFDVRLDLVSLHVSAEKPHKP